MKRSAKKNSRSVQLELAYPPGRGGVRPRAGRKPKGENAGVSHAGREEFHARYPVHVAMKVVEGLPSLRSRPMFRVVQQAILQARERLGIRNCEYSVPSSHLHLIGAATRRAAATRARAPRRAAVRARSYAHRAPSRSRPAALSCRFKAAKPPPVLPLQGFSPEGPLQRKNRRRSGTRPHAPIPRRSPTQ